jgi:tRNA threonylcarbamoyladenosine biosynthesis protein TsaB
MNLLAIETSSEFCSVAAARGDATFQRHEAAGQRHGELVIPMIDAVLAEAGLALSDLDGIAYGAGPGAFTGLRIACGVTQGLALARGLPVVGIVTLAAVAEEAAAGVRSDQECAVVACIDARMRAVYHAAYRRTGARWREVLAPGLHAPDAVPLPDGEGWTGAGSGFAAYREALERRHGGRLAAIRPELVPTARAVLRLAAAEFAAGRGADAAEAVPVYLRDKVALKTSERA